MVDPILLARLNVLEQNLASAESKDWLVDKLDQVEVADEVWGGLEATIGREARVQANRIRNLRRSLRDAEARGEAGTDADIATAWKEYGAVYQESQDLFGEFLEFIGGLAFRSRDLDEQICRLADELIQSCSMDARGNHWQSVTVPARREAVTTSLARIIRLRFPERTIWTLPFTAHEFGHVLMEEDPDLNGFIGEQAQSWLGQRVRFGRGRIMNESTAKLYLSEFLADAFATYYMGPAYVAAAVHLRFDPTTALREDEENPSDLARARVILGMLRHMNDAAGTAPYTSILERLRQDWDAVCSCSSGPKLKSAEIARIDHLVSTVYRYFQVPLLRSAEFPVSGYSGWHVATNWQSGWHRSLEMHTTLMVPRDITQTSKLRDALNAAWICRVRHPNDVKEITDVGLRLCEQIVAKRHSRAPTSTRLGPSS